jgi:hypothetical protein
LLLAALANGCASELALPAPSYKLQGARVVFMPAMVALYTLSSEGQMVSFGSGGPGLSVDAHLEFMDGKSKSARTVIDQWMKRFAESHDSRIAELDEVTPTRLPANTFYNVMDRVTDQIIIDWLKNNRGYPMPLSHWGAEGRFLGWGSALEADYVVFVKFAGSYETPSLKDVRSRRIATLAVVDVRTGRIVCVRGIHFDNLDPADVGQYMRMLTAPLERAQAPS